MPLVSESEHKAQAPSVVSCYVLTVSDTRSPMTDTSGALIRDVLEKAGHRVSGSMVVRDEPEIVAQIITREADRGRAHAIIITGGTGVSTRDGSYEAVSSLLDKQLDGFGELFRMLSYQDIGPAAMLSRATAGIVGRTAVFLLPGSESAVRLGMEELILPELGHIVQQIRK